MTQEFQQAAVKQADRVLTTPAGHASSPTTSPPRLSSEAHFGGYFFAAAPPIRTDQVLEAGAQHRRPTGQVDQHGSSGHEYPVGKTLPGHHWILPVVRLRITINPTP